MTFEEYIVLKYQFIADDTKSEHVRHYTFFAKSKISGKSIYCNIQFSHEILAVEINDSLKAYVQGIIDGCDEDLHREKK